MKHRILSPARVGMLAVAGVLTVFAAGAPAVASVATPAPTTPAATPVQQAEAIAQPSVVFIRTVWTGWLTHATFSGVDVADLLSSNGSAPKFTVTTTCSGWIADPSGYVVTAGHCVDDQSMAYGGRGLIVEAAVSQIASDVGLTAAEAQSMLTYGYQNWTVEGSDKGAPPDRAVGVYQTKAASGVTVTEPMQAKVVDVEAFTKGDVALLKVESKSAMPALIMATAQPATGTQVVAAGYPGSVSDTVDPSNDPSMKDGSISAATRTVAGVPFTEISAATSSGMSGGPVFDLQGRVVGTVSWSPGAETQAFNFMTATSSLHELVSRNGVTTTLSATDQAYRDGLTAYFAGKYHDAVTKFDAVLALEPAHALAQQYKQQSIQNYPNEKKAASSSSSTMLYVGIGAGVAVLLVVLAAFLSIRHRRAGAAGAAVTTAPGPQPLLPTVSAVEPGTQPFAGAPVTQPVAEAPVTQPVAEAPVRGEAAAGHFCSFCGAPHDADAHFCAECGLQFPSKLGHGAE